MNGEDILSASSIELNGPYEQYDHGDFNALYWQLYLLAAVYLAVGKHVILEKLLAVSLRAGRYILDVVLDNRLILVVADNYRCSPTEPA